MNAVLAQVLAHESGFSWDEALIVLTPLVIIGALLWMVRRRVRRNASSSSARDVGAE